MQKQQRPAAELLHVARLLGEEKRLIVDHWLTRLKAHSVFADGTGGKRLTVRDDGLLALDLGGTKVISLAAFTSMPLGSLNLNGCKQIADFTPISTFRSLTSLHLGGTGIDDLAALNVLALEDINLDDTRVTKLDPLRAMPLKKISLAGTRVSNLGPLAGRPITELNASRIPADDFSPLLGAPLERCILSQSAVRDLSFLRDSPLQELTLSGCDAVRGFAILAGLKSLKLLVLPSSFRGLSVTEYSAIQNLRTHPLLENLGEGGWQDSYLYQRIWPRDEFWKVWDREQAFVPALRRSGVSFYLSTIPDGTYRLHVHDQPLSNLAVLKGAPISKLLLVGCQIRDLAPLRELPVDLLNLAKNPLADLSPLRGLPLESLYLDDTAVSDLSPLANLPLKSLHLAGCKNLTDVSALTNIPTLEKITVPINTRNIQVLHSLTNLQMLSYQINRTFPFVPDMTAEEFWKDFEQDWDMALRKSGFAVKKRLKLPDGTWELSLEDAPIADLTILSNAPVSILGLGGTIVSNLAPLQGMKLKHLLLFRTDVSDLEPLRRMPIERLNLAKTKVADLAPLRGAPLISLRLHGCTQIRDLSPLAELTTLKELTLPPNATNVAVLRASPSLERVSYEENGKTFLPTKTAAEFWRDFDAGQGRE